MPEKEPNPPAPFPVKKAVRFTSFFRGYRAHIWSPKLKSSEIPPILGNSKGIDIQVDPLFQGALRIHKVFSCYDPKNNGSGFRKITPI